jgi:hypothetical protein
MRQGRLFVTSLALIFLVCTAAAADEPLQPEKPAAPLEGTWAKTCDDDTVVELQIGATSIAWVSRMPQRGTTTMRIPAYAISAEGILFGYVAEMNWTDGNARTSGTMLTPFAFRFDRVNDSMEMSELRLPGANAEAIDSLCGTYHRSPELAVEALAAPR